MKNKTNKRAFTIVELVIVIAVIAILAAVLIPTFSNLVKKAQASKDTQLIRNLNTALAVDKTSGNTHNTMTDALDAAKEAGYLVDKINASNTDNEILWDSKNDVFCYLEGEADKPTYIPETTLTVENPANVDYWRITNEDKYLKDEAKYSVYYTGTSTTIETTVGFDVGDITSITSITYINTSVEQNVVIRTNSAKTSLTVYAPNDEITHYGFLGVAYIRAIKQASYYESGKVAFLEINDGHVEVTQNGSIDLIYSRSQLYKVENNVISEDSVEDKPVVKVTNHGKVNHAHASSETNSTNTNSISYGITFDYDGSSNEYTKADPHRTTVNHEYGTYANDGTNSWNIDYAKNEAVINMASKEAAEKAPIPSNPDIEYVAVNVSKLNRSEDDAYYTSLYNALYYARSGDTVALLKDYTLTRYIAFAKNYTIDLNGYTLFTENMPGSMRQIFVASTMTIKNGTINHNTDLTTGYAIGTFNNSYPGNLTLDNLVINTIVNGDSEVNCYAVGMMITGDKLTINSGKYNGVIGTLGSEKDYKITINGGEFYDGCYFPGAGEYEINGGIFSSLNGPIFYWKSGSPLKINSGEFNVILTDDYNGGKWAHFGNGTYGGNAALVVEACNYGNHGNPTISINKDIKFNINKGSYEGAFYDVLIINYGYTPEDGIGCFSDPSKGTENRVNCDGINIPYRVANGQIICHETSMVNDEYKEPTDGWVYFNDDNTTLISPDNNNHK